MPHIQRLTGLAFVMLLTTAAHGQQIKVVQQPTFWIVGQWTRIMVETPADCQALEVRCPEQIKLLGRWPHKRGDTTQRFYLRALKPVRATITFRAGEHTAALPVRVMSWQDVLNEKFIVEVTDLASVAGTYPVEPRAQLPRSFPLQGGDKRKSGLSYLTTADIEKQKKEFKQLADHAARLATQVEDLAKLFYSVPESAIPRAVYVNHPESQKVAEPVRGCPVCGPKVFEGRSAFYPWVLDPDNHPYKIQCPECNRWFPSNDFANNDFTSGEFPDDGWNYFDAKGRPYSFIGYYVLQKYRGGERRAELYSRMYLANGDTRLARGTALLLVRVAEQYLNLSLNLNQRAGATQEALWSGAIPPQNTQTSMSWSPYGFYLDGVWSIGPDAMYAEAFERIWDYWAAEDPQLIQFLQANGHPEIKTMQDVKDFIEVGYFRTVAQGCIDRAVSGNGPSEQAMAMRLARFLNTPSSIKLTEWVFNDPAHGVRYYLPNRFFIDGSGYESPGYNSAHYHGILALADMLSPLAALRPEQYAKADFPMLTDSPKFKAMFDHNIDLTLISRTRPYVGDDGDLADTDPLPIRPGSGLPRATWAKAFERWPRNSNYAKALWDRQKNAPADELTDLSLREQATRIVQREGPYLELPSRVLPGFGHVVLSSGKKDDQRDLWMRYGSMFVHRHHDALTIGYEALMRTLLPEQGYNRGDSHRTEWDMNWAMHYCARITGASKDTAEGWGRQGQTLASLQLFADGGWAKVATAARRFYSEAPAPQVVTLSDDLLQQRTVALVDVDEKYSYAVSIFRVGGGTDHYLSFHGPRGAAQAQGLSLTAQPNGTLAGPDVPYGMKWDSEWSKKNPHLMMFPFLYDVRRAPSAGAWRVAWDLDKHPDVHLRLHGLPPARTEVALAKGKPPGGGAPYELQWVVQHVSGGEPLSSTFIEVIEAYKGGPLISDVRRLGSSAEQAVAFQVVLGDRMDTIIHNPDPTATVTTSNGITMTGAFGIWSEQAGKVQRVLLVDGGRIAAAGREVKPKAPTWTGTIQSADFANARIIVSPAPPRGDESAGRYVRITNAAGNDTTHQIKAVASGGEIHLTHDPRIGQGPVRQVHADGVESGVRLLFEGPYYLGKTLANEDASVRYAINGVDKSRAYINSTMHPKVNKQVLASQFPDKDRNGIAEFVIYDYGPGDRVTLPSIATWTAD
jgi:hypothetical protein